MAALSEQPDALKGIGRGVEREALRITPEGTLSSAAHPIALGSALTHQWITTDFAEQLLEFITPVTYSVPDMLTQLQDIHRFTYRAMDGESLWPLSMPCYVENEDDITLAQYGTSNVGQMKTLYRQGLKHRYGSVMQVISGVHFNFSFPDSFWQSMFGDQAPYARQESVSDAYFGLIRNYYRFGWMIPYLFGASPALCGSFIDQTKTNLDFTVLGKGTNYLPYATSLRLSDLGYTNSAQSGLKIGFNGLDQYLEGVRAAIRTPSADFAKMGVKDASGYNQLNANVLQIENELYAPIRPKRVAKSGEKPSEALERGGVEYIEVRSLDVNPFSPTGIDDTQVYFLDLFVTWCALSDSEPMTDCELPCWRDNWNKIVLEGRKPGLTLQIGCQGEQLTQAEWGRRVFADLSELAVVMDKAYGGDNYQKVCHELVSWFDEPEKTLSARLLREVIEQQSIGKVGLAIAKQNAELYSQGEYHLVSESQFIEESRVSLKKQQDVEQGDAISFDQYLAEYFGDSVSL
ncbi:glutamate--cysteine ligase [Enterovibrio sp. ZSDZ42]|uniref:Glutamate--cysteine ligase n=1 Tax=Enterovibrio gelatinilyticus TaxID=2899819 RepID=A0ABT5QUZ0_9GAMM|nr:glutamate--cysteine ligase [Enterovibrio sp. ZSDZ42]MDD1791824.1 glutamate--cysteine ligase [Enterovibrio sp. ZSDZ42]